jgi:hypothetical protein
MNCHRRTKSAKGRRATSNAIRIKLSKISYLAGISQNISGSLTTSTHAALGRPGGPWGRLRAARTSPFNHYCRHEENFFKRMQKR